MAEAFTSTISRGPATDAIAVSAIAGRAEVASTSTFVIYDSTTTPPTAIGTPNPPQGMNRIFATDTRTYGATQAFGGSSAGLTIFDSSNPTTPTLLGQYSGIYAEDVFAKNDLAYVSSDGLWVIDVSSPTSQNLHASLLPRSVVSLFRTGCGSYGLTAAFPRLFLSCGYQGVLVINVADPTAPWLEADINATDYTQHALAQNGYLYAADYGSGLFAAPYSPITLIAPGTAPAQGIALDYTANWSPAVPNVRGACRTSAGACSVTSFDAGAGTATIRWTLPNASGAATLEFDVGNWQRFVRARDRVLVP